MSAPGKAPAGLITISTAATPVEKFCAIGDPLIIEWKGKRYHTVMRGMKVEFITTNILGGKPRLTVLQDTSFLITDIPNGYAEAGFEHNSPLTVRFLSGGSVYAFKTMMMRAHNRPPTLVLEYPNEVQRYDLRSNKRLIVVSPARISKNGESTPRMGAVLDISEAGARIGLEVAGIGVGEQLNLSFTLPNGVAVNQLPIDVRSIEEENGKHHLGVRFCDPDAAVNGYCREYAVFATEAQPVWSNSTLGLEKEAVIEFSKKSGQVLLRGWKMGEKGFLLTEKPQGYLPPLSLGQDAIIRVENRGTIYGMSVIYKEFLKKTALCYFPIQNDVVSHSLRQEDRVQCLLPATVHGAENQTAALGSGVIVNLGKGGLRFITGVAMPVKPDDTLAVSFHPGGIGFIDRQKMLLVRMSGPGGRLEYAARFIDISAEHGKLLDDYFTFCKTWVM